MRIRDIPRLVPMLQTFVNYFMYIHMSRGPG